MVVKDDELSIHSCMWNISNKKNQTLSDLIRSLSKREARMCSTLDTSSCVIVRMEFRACHYMALKAYFDSLVWRNILKIIMIINLEINTRKFSLCLPLNNSMIILYALCRNTFSQRNLKCCLLNYSKLFLMNPYLTIQFWCWGCCRCPCN